MRPQRRSKTKPVQIPYFEEESESSSDDEDDDDREKEEGVKQKKSSTTCSNPRRNGNSSTNSARAAGSVASKKKSRRTSRSSDEEDDDEEAVVSRKRRDESDGDASESDGEDKKPKAVESCSRRKKESKRKCNSEIDDGEDRAVKPANKLQKTDTTARTKTTEPQSPSASIPPRKSFASKPDDSTAKGKSKSKSAGKTSLKRKAKGVKPLVKVEEKAIRSKNLEREASDDEDQEALNQTDEQINENMAFCCKTCACREEQKKKLKQNVHFQGIGTLWHRNCCHNVAKEMCKGVNDKYALPVVIAKEQWDMERETALIDRGEEMDTTPKKPPEKNTYSRKVLKQMYLTAKKLESEIHNQDGQPTPDSILLTDRHYMEKILPDYNQLKAEIKERGTKRACVVLNLFAGIGTGILVLKRLKIAIKTVIHCEPDKVATHVYKFNHDFAYNSRLRGENAPYNERLHDDGVEHVYYDEIEDVFEGVDDLLQQHGPIDVVLGSPPGGDYSAANPRRQGTRGYQGGYILMMADLVQRINDHPLQHGNPLFFWAENVPIVSNKEDRKKPLAEMDLTMIKEAFGIKSEMEIDAKDFSPCRRKRHYLSNIPLLANLDFNGDQHPHTCLEEPFKVASFFLEREMSTTPKIPTFMASQTSLDDDRMVVFSEKEVEGKTKYVGRALTTREREAMMGFPCGYVEDPVKMLFKELLTKGLFQYYRYESANWIFELPKDYHCFNGAYHKLSNGYRFHSVEVDGIKLPLLKMAPQVPTGQKRPSFLDFDQYGKRLIGNAFSVPAAELMLSPLRELYAEKEYPEFVYSFAWQRGAGNGVMEANGAEVEAGGVVTMEADVHDYKDDDEAMDDHATALPKQEGNDDANLPHNVGVKREENNDANLPPDSGVKSERNNDANLDHDSGVKNEGNNDANLPPDVGFKSDGNNDADLPPDAGVKSEGNNDANLPHDAVVESEENNDANLPHDAGVESDGNNDADLPHDVGVKSDGNNDADLPRDAVVKTEGNNDANLPHDAGIKNEGNNDTNLPHDAVVESGGNDDANLDDDAGVESEGNDDANLPHDAVVKSDGNNNANLPLGAVVKSEGNNNANLPHDASVESDGNNDASREERRIKIETDNEGNPVVFDPLPVAESDMNVPIERRFKSEEASSSPTSVAADDKSNSGGGLNNDDVVSSEKGEGVDI